MIGSGFRDQIDDARMEMRAWAQGIAWSAVAGGTGLILTGLATRDSAVFASGFTAVVVAFFPRARPRWVYELAKTWTIKHKWIKVPSSELPWLTPGEIKPYLRDREK